jgi:thymidylate synthase ThyX
MYKADQWRKQSTTNKQSSTGLLEEDWPEGWYLKRERLLGIGVYNKDEQVCFFPANVWSGIKENMTPSELCTYLEVFIQTESRRAYECKLKLGVARELARKDLPLSTYTEAYWKINLHNLLHFLRLRLDNKAQYEIRQYAKAIGKIVSEIVPTTWKYFVQNNNI